MSVGLRPGLWSHLITVLSSTHFSTWKLQDVGDGKEESMLSFQTTFGTSSRSRGERNLQWALWLALLSFGTGSEALCEGYLMTRLTYMETQNTYAYSTLLTRKAGKGLLIDIIPALVNTEKILLRGAMKLKWNVFSPSDQMVVFYLFGLRYVQTCFQSLWNRITLQLPCLVLLCFLGVVVWVPFCALGLVP